MTSKTLRQAHRLFRRKQYGKLISNLEPQVFMFRDNVEYYTLLGAACFCTGDYGGCTSYTKRAIDIDPDIVSAHLYLAAVYLKRRETDRAIREWLHVLDRDPNNTHAKRGLDFVRSLTTIDELQERITPSVLLRFVPVKNYIPWKTVFLTIAALLALGLAWYFGPDAYRYIYKETAPPRDGVEVVSFPQGQPLTSLEGEYEYILSESEIQEILDRIRTYFNSHQDNLVRREINRILLSTATSPVKERVRILRSSLAPPDFTSIKTSFSFSEVSQNLQLYSGTYIRWKGRPTNIVRGEDAVDLTLLVGYHTGQIVEGSVPVHIPFPAQIRSEMGIELIAQVIPLNSNAHPSGSPFYLETSAIRLFELEN